MNLNKLFEKAKAAQKNAYAPYSKFYVGAALVDDKGDLYSGCNVENAAYPIGCCAEQSAVSQMIVNGGKTIQQILVIGNSGITCPPCGACRQIIAEHGNASTQVHLETGLGEFKTQGIYDLLPDAFNGSQLDK